MTRPTTLALCGVLLACHGEPGAALAPRPARAEPTAHPLLGPREDACGALRCGWVHQMMRPDQVPPLERPRHVSAARARGLLRPRDRVIGLSLGGQDRAYPLNLLAYHRVVNDELGGRRVAVAHSPLSGSALCALSPGPLAHSGKVYEGDDLLADRADALWSVLLGRRLQGQERLERAPCVEITWAAWRRLRPRTTVVWPATAPRGFDYRQDPWAWYRRDDRHLAAPLHRIDLRLPHKQPVLGLELGEASFVVPLAGRRVVSTRLGGEALALVMDPRAGFGAAYRRLLDGRELTLEARPGRGPLELVDRQTQSRWNLLGEAIAGPLAGRRLEPVGARAFFFAWAALHPTRPSQITFLARRDNHG